MDTKIIICFIAGVIFAAIIGFVIGKNWMHPEGSIIFTIGEEGNMKCIFKLDMEIEDILSHHYILFNVEKEKDILKLYESGKETVEN